jgi:hypothetical protein
VSGEDGKERPEETIERVLMFSLLEILFIFKEKNIERTESTKYLKPKVLSVPSACDVFS